METLLEARKEESSFAKDDSFSCRLAKSWKQACLLAQSDLIDQSNEKVSLPGAIFKTEELLFWIKFWGKSPVSSMTNRIDRIINEKATAEAQTAHKKLKENFDGTNDIENEDQSEVLLYLANYFVEKNKTVCQDPKINRFETPYPMEKMRTLAAIFAARTMMVFDFEATMKGAHPNAIHSPAPASVN